MENNNKKGRWVTINGAHVLIKNGQSVNEAMQETFKGKRGKKRVNQGKFEYSADEGNTWEDMDEQSYNELDADEDAFDENIEDDFGFDEEKGFKIYEDKIREELEKVKSKEDAEYVSDLIDDNMEAGYISEELADELYNELDKKIDEFSENEEPTSPMTEFSGPDREGPSYAQLDAMKEKDPEREKAISKIKEIADRINATDADDINGYLTNGESDYIKYLAQRHKISPEELKQIGGRTFDKNIAYDADEYGWKEPQSAKETWPPQDLKQYIKKTEDGYAFDTSIFDDKSLEEIEMALDHPDAKNNLVVRNGIMAAAYKKLKNMSEYGKTSQNMKIPDNVRTISGEKPTINPADVTNEPNRNLYSYLKEKYPDAEQNSLVSSFLEANGLKDSGLKGTDSIADVYEAMIKQESAPDTKEMEKINFDKRMKRVENIRDELESIGFRFNHSKYSDEQLNQFEDKISEFNKLKSERKLKEAAKIRNEIEAML